MSYYLEEVEKRAKYEGARSNMKALTDAMSIRDVDAIERVVETMGMKMRSARFDTAEGLRMFDDVMDEVIQTFNLTRFSGTISGITCGWDAIDQQTWGYQKGDLIAWVARLGRGKAQPLDSLVRVPGGWKRMGDLKVGDSVSSPDGELSRVAGIFPQGKVPTYEVAFADGRKTKTSDQHLWTVFNHYWKEERTVTTLELIDLLNHPKYGYYIRVPLVNGYLGDSHKELPLHPWVVGALIGDGGLKNEVMFSSADDHNITRLRQLLPFGSEVRHRSMYDYVVVQAMGTPSRNFVRDILRDLDLFGKGSHEKRIPEEYLTASYDQRLGLMQGLMDTDGYVSTCGTCNIAVSNEHLAYDIQKLARSLGCIAKITVRKTTHKDSYKVNLRCKNTSKLFTLPRKKERCKGTDCQYSSGLGLRVSHVKRLPVDEDCQCITVTHPSHLYVTDDYIVTHNTMLLLKQALAASVAGHRTLIVSPEMPDVQLVRRMIGMLTGINPRLIARGQLSNIVYDRMMERLDEIRGTLPMQFMAGAVEKTMPRVKQAIRDFDADYCCGDAAYLIRPGRSRSGSGSRREVISDMADEAKEIASSENIPFNITVQFNRTAVRSDRTEGSSGEQRASNRDPLAHLDVHKIGETDVIAQNASLVFVSELGDAPNPYASRYIGIKKGRDGDEGWWKINYLFNPFNMDIIEDGNRGAGQQTEDINEEDLDEDIS